MNNILATRLRVTCLCLALFGCDGAFTSDDEATLTLCQPDEAQCDIGISLDQHLTDSEITTPADAAVVDAALPPCQYPEAASERLDTGSIMPLMRWTDAQNELGENTPLDLEDVYCKRPGFADVDTIVFAVGTQWCPNCPYLFGVLAEHSDTVYSNRGLIAWLEIQNPQYGPVGTESAAVTINQQAGASRGYRLGDASTLPTPNTFINIAPLPSFPAFMVVRTSDMRIISPWVTLPERLLKYVEDPASQDPN